MRVIENYENIQASSGEFARPGNGGYILEIVNVFQFPPLREGRQQCLTKNIYGFCLICCVLYHI